MTPPTQSDCKISGPSSGKEDMRDLSNYANAHTSPAIREALVTLAERVIPPAVLGYRCLPIEEPGLIVNVSIYRDVQHDEDGIPCGRGVIGGDAQVYWYSEPPEEVLRCER